MAKYESLGIAPLPTGTIEHDFAILTKFQEYSAELLRISLLGITAIGIVVSQTLLGKPSETVKALCTLQTLRWSVYFALGFFSLSVASALYHRYTSADSVAWHLQAMRRYVRGSSEDLERADTEKNARWLQFRRSQVSLQLSAGCLALGAAAFAAALAWALAVS